MMSPFEGAYAFSGYTVDYFQFDDYEGIQDLLIFLQWNSGMARYMERSS